MIFEIFEIHRPLMSKAEKKKKESPSMAAWQKLDSRLAMMHALIHKKKENLHKLEAEWGASTDEEEKRYMATSIKAARLDLQEDINFFQDNAATKAVLEEELENATSEEEEEEIDLSGKTTGEETFTKKEVDKMLKTEVERRMREEKQDATLTATNSKMDRLITALSEGRGSSSGGAEARERCPQGAKGGGPWAKPRPLSLGKVTSSRTLSPLRTSLSSTT